MNPSMTDGSKEHEKGSISTYLHVNDISNAALIQQLV